ncbi:MAG: putative rRNA maturation factor, partial [Rhodospirillaceae bacterium]
DGSVSSCLAVDIRIEILQWLETLPEVEQVCRAAAFAAVATGWRRRNGKGRLFPLPDSLPDEGLELAILLADDVWVRDLNRDYRGMDQPTNVLSFAALDAPDEPSCPGEPLALGDVVLALQTIQREAEQRAIPLADHLRHLVIHGVLHLLGYDHQEDDTAEVMEQLEVRILAELGVDNPYIDPGVATAKQL